MRLEIFFQVLGQLLEVPFILVRQTHVRDARAPSSDDLLLYDSDWEHFTRQGQLAGHGQVLAHRFVSNTRRRTVFGGCAVGHVYM